MSEEVVFTKTEDLNRPYRVPVFQDGFVHFFPPMLDEQSYVVVEVRCVTVAPSSDKTKPADKRNTEPDLIVEPKTAEGKSFWTLFPVSKEKADGGGYKYTMSGTYQLPLIKGAIPGSDLFSSETANPLQEVLDRLGPKGRAAGKASNMALALSDGCSVILRVCNPLFRKMLPFASNAPENPAMAADAVGKLNTDIMEKMLHAAANGITGPQAASAALFAYSGNKFNLARGDKSTAQRLPGGGAGVDLKKLAKDVNKLFSKESGIQLEA